MIAVKRWAEILIRSLADVKWLSVKFRTTGFFTIRQDQGNFDFEVQKAQKSLPGPELNA